MRSAAQTPDLRSPLPDHRAGQAPRFARRIDCGERPGIQAAPSSGRGEPLRDPDLRNTPGRPPRD